MSRKSHLSFSRLHDLHGLRQYIIMNYFKHESAYVDDGAVIGDGTKIWHFCHVQSGARIGMNCILGQNVNVAGDVVI